VNGNEERYRDEDENEMEEELYTAGERVPSGRYKHVDSPYILKLDGDDTLPARLDGHVTYYVRICMWGDALPSDPPMSLSPVNGLGSENGRTAVVGTKS